MKLLGIFVMVAAASPPGWWRWGWPIHNVHASSWRARVSSETTTDSGEEASSTRYLANRAGRNATTSTHPPRNKLPLKIVNLGDSFASGTGARTVRGRLPTYVRPWFCSRALNSYGDQYARHLNQKGYAVTFLNRACSRATIRNILGPQDLHLLPGSCLNDTTAGPPPVSSCSKQVPPQMDAVDDSVDLVMLMVGLNDLGFGRIRKACWLFWTLNAVDCQNSMNDAYTRLENEYKPDLQNLYQALRQKLTPAGATQPRGRVVQVWYPHVARDVEYYLTNETEGVSINPAVAFRTLLDVAGRAVAEVVAQANAEAGVEYITFWNQTPALFAGHEADTRPRHNNPFKWIFEYAVPFYFETFHPNWKYHLNLGEALADSGTFGAPVAGITQFNSSSSKWPYAWIGETYLGKVGVPVTIDASGSYDPAGYDLTSYEWDLDGDGIVDATTSVPEVTTTYLKPYLGMVTLRLTNSQGSSVMAKAFMEVSKSGYSGEDFGRQCELDSHGFPLLAEDDSFSFCMIKSWPRLPW